jgi:hypothetical protein
MLKAMRLRPIKPALPYWQMMMGAACLQLQRTGAAAILVGRSAFSNTTLVMEPRVTPRRRRR